MIKETMIWQILSMSAARMVKDKTIPEDKELFQKKCIESVKSIMADVSDEEILIVMNNYDITGFAEKMSSLNAPMIEKEKYNAQKNNDSKDTK